MNFNRDQWDDLLTTGGGLLSLLDDAPDPSELIGEQFGSFTIIELIDQGGMACVYRAERSDDQFRQQVAIKIIHAGLRQPELADSFLSERQILADLDHPFIARIYDSGITEDNRPWLSMEFIDGQAMDLWCDQQQPSVQTILESVINVCDAVQSAHDSGIIHQDLKPGNILMDAHQQPKLLDFGIARSHRNRDEASGDIAAMFTPLIAAPEQLRGEAGTRQTDVWQIGVLLYRLLSGHYPFEADGNIETLRENILGRQHQKLKPRSSISRLMRLGLDDLFNRCFQKDMAERYDSVKALAEDLNRLLSGQSLHNLGQGESRSLQSFLLRHSRWIAASVVLISAAGTGWYINEQRLAAERAQTETMTNLLVDAINASDPATDDGALSDLITSADFENVTQSDRNPAAARRVVVTTASRMIDRSEFRQAIDLLTPLISGTVADGTVSDEHIEYLSLLGYAWYRLGDLDRASPMLEQAHAAIDRLPADDFRARAGVLQRFGLLKRRVGDGAAALQLIEQAHAIIESELAGESLLIARVNNHLGLVLVDNNRLPEGIRAYRRSIEFYDKAGSQELARALTHSNLADALRLSGDLDQALKIATETIALVDTNPQSLPQHRAMARVSVGNVLMQQQSYEDAIGYYRPAHEIYLEAFEEGHPRLAVSAHNLATAYRQNGQCELAIPLYEMSIETNQARFGSDHPRVAESRRQRALCNS